MQSRDSTIIIEVTHSSSPSFLLRALVGVCIPIVQGIAVVSAGDRQLMYERL